ncbi:MAG: hypothetical protein LBC74_04895 [Planctomycetaceae bacterium]|jgi:hypothetical protein|nr:hypothetical protein [Planctomycetaceae bacterium]
MKNHLKNYTQAGLRIYGSRGHIEVRDCIIRFAKWIRKEKTFPVRLNVYLSPCPILTAQDGDQCVGLIRIPNNPVSFPYIRLATGDYKQRKSELGRDNALAGDLCTFCHEMIHYWQWIETDRMWENGVYRKAQYIVDQYAQTTEHP